MNILPSTSKTVLNTTINQAKIVMEFTTMIKMVMDNNDTRESKSRHNLSREYEIFGTKQVP
jgi:hypothetical protein